MTENIHPCSQQQTIGEMHGLLKTLVKQVYGNGHKGLATTVPELSTKIEILSETIVLLSQNVSALMKFENEVTGKEIYIEKNGLTTRGRAAILVSAIVGGASIITALIVKFA
jgi:hypothetical protein